MRLNYVKSMCTESEIRADHCQQFPAFCQHLFGLRVGPVGLENSFL